MLTAMKMTAMAAEFANQLKDPAFNELGFEERPGLAGKCGMESPAEQQTEPFYPQCTLCRTICHRVEGIEYYEDRKLDKAQMLRFATCQYIDEGHHIILKGASGNGKNLHCLCSGKMRPAAVLERYSTSVCRNC